MVRRLASDDTGGRASAPPAGAGGNPPAGGGALGHDRRSLGTHVGKFEHDAIVNPWTAGRAFRQPRC